MADAELMTAEISQALGRLASYLNLTPDNRDEIVKDVPKGAKKISDLPEYLQFLIGKADEAAGLAAPKPAKPAKAPAKTRQQAAADGTRVLMLNGKRLEFSTATAARPKTPPPVPGSPRHREMNANNGPGHGPHPDDTGEGHRELPEKWRGLLVPYDVAAPDGRIIAGVRGAPKSREMPQPLTAQQATSDGHDNAVLIGRVNRIWTQDNALWGEGEFDLGTEAGRDWAGRVARGMAGWGSVDLDAGTAPRIESQGKNKVARKTYDDWTFAGFTLVSRPAFDAARIAPYWGDSEDGDCERRDPKTGMCLDELEDEHEFVDNPRNARMPEEVDKVLRSIDPDVIIEAADCGCEHATEAAMTSSGKLHPIGDRFAEWDADAAVGRVRTWAGVNKDNPTPADWAKYGQAFFWHADSPSKFGDFKLPYADVVDGKLTAMPRGIFAAAGSLQGSRGQKPDLPDGDVAKVKSKVSAYYRKLKMTAPWDSKTAAAYVNEPVLVAGGQYAGTVTGYDRDGGWLRISCDNGTEIICTGEDVEHADSLTAAVAAGPIAPPDQWFTDPKLTGPTPLQIRDDGRVYGHLALWGTCHVGFADTCVTAPRSYSEYSHFHVGEVELASGNRIPVGKLTIGGGHAAPAAGWRAAASHYDNTGSAVAVVRAGEDAHGIWVAGALVPEATPAQVVALRRSPLSGDWRRIGANLELVAALAVNTPGFPIPRPRAGIAMSQQASLVAAGVIDRAEYELGERLERIVTNSMMNVLDAYAARRQRAAAAVQRINAATTGMQNFCGEHCDCAEDDEDEDEQ